MNAKVILLLPCLASILTISGKIIVPGYDPNFVTDFPVIGPFEQYSEDYDLIGTITPQKSYSAVREKLAVGVIGEEKTYYSAKANHSVSAKSSYQLTFKLPFKTMLGSRGLNCQITIIDSSQNVLKSFSFNIKPKESKTINPSNYLKTYYSIPNTIVDPDEYDDKVSESFSFNGFVDYFMVDNYYRLSLDNLYLTYLGLRDCPLTRIYLHFDDYDNLFPDFSTGQGMTSIDIPVDLFYGENSTICFKFAANLYVNPKTLDMAPTAKTGYSLTNYFYLPINRKNDFMNQKFTLTATSFGHNETQFAWDIRYLTDRGLIGDCGHSDYCVRGTV